MIHLMTYGRPFVKKEGGSRSCVVSLLEIWLQKFHTIFCGNRNQFSKEFSAKFTQDFRKGPVCLYRPHQTTELHTLSRSDRSESPRHGGKRTNGQVSGLDGLDGQ